MVGVLRAEVTTQAGERWLVKAERDPDSGGWVPVDYEDLDADGVGHGVGAAAMTRVRALPAVRVPVAWRLARRLVPLVVALVVVRVAVEVVGQTVTAAVLAPVILVWGLGRWAAMERRLDQHHRQTTPLVVPPGHGRVDQGGEHVAFARALVAVSARYLAACEDQADEHNTWDASREGWR